MVILQGHLNSEALCELLVISNVPVKFQYSAIHYISLPSICHLKTKESARHFPGFFKKKKSQI